VAVDKHEEECVGETDESLVVVVSQSGSISAMQQSPEASVSDGEPSPRSIDDLWPAEVTQVVRRTLKRSLRTRQQCSENLKNPSDGKSYEFLYVPQGRDRVLLIVRNLSNERALLAQLKRLAYTDPTTQLPNRESLLRQLRTVTELQRLKQGRAAVICLYVGGIGEHEYAMGTVALDAILRELSERLQSGTRMALGGTTTGDLERHTIVARTDFRQFAVVLPAIETGEDAESVIQRLIDVAQRPMEVSGRKVSPALCGGVALFPQDGVEAATLLDGAESAMNEARNEPAGSYRFQSGTVRLHSLQRQDLERELRVALERRQYAIRFLPVVGARDHSPVTMEALLRWPDTAFGQQSTKKLIRVAERTGMMVPIGAWVLQRACEQLQDWHRKGHERIRAAVNLSQQELAHPGVAERVADVLREAGTDPANLDIEINEQVLCRDAANDYAVCRALASTGVRIVLDDYGSGVSSLVHLSRSPISALKLDRCLVSNIERNDHDGAVCAATVAMAAKLGMTVTAEGVETERQAQVMREIGCEYLQGFLFATPMTESEVLDYLQPFDRRAEPVASP
jgi:EAL domain-containing protein (putative c-di-GMP-specific phosphodiesterase class I)/GGDEF domain-containing protein